MSALTKVFVVLHVILSLLLAAGLIVFVNRVDDFRTTNVATTAQLRNAERERDIARADAEVAIANQRAAVTAANNQASALQRQLDTANQQILDARGELAKCDAQLASLTASLQSAQAAQQAAQTNQGVLQAQLIETRTTADEVQRRLTDANLAISDLSNRNQVLERQLRNALEEIAALKEEAEQADSRQASDDRPAAPGQANVSINGEIRATQTISGMKYATISVGSADAVREGMQFRVLGGPNKNQFLGYVIVTRVEPNEAVGRLEGPKVDQIAPEDEVRTRL